MNTLFVNLVLEFFILIAFEKTLGLFSFLILKSSLFKYTFESVPIISLFFSSMSQYYDKTISGYSKDIDHLVSFNKNGLWIKENFKIRKTKNFDI